MDDLTAELERAAAGLEGDRFNAVERLRELEERWARLRLGLALGAELTQQVRHWVERDPDPALAAEAAEHLSAAETWQREIGTWASGSGEGLASMAQVRMLQAARAWLLAAAGDVESARALIRQVEADPNGQNSVHLESVRALERRLPAE